MNDFEFDIDTYSNDNIDFDPVFYIDEEEDEENNIENNTENNTENAEENEENNDCSDGIDIDINNFEFDPNFYNSDSDD